MMTGVFMMTRYVRCVRTVVVVRCAVYDGRCASVCCVCTVCYVYGVPCRTVCRVCDDGVGVCVIVGVVVLSVLSYGYGVYVVGYVVVRQTVTFHLSRACVAFCAAACCCASSRFARMCYGVTRRVCRRARRTRRRVMRLRACAHTLRASRRRLQYGVVAFRRMRFHRSQVVACMLRRSAHASRASRARRRSTASSSRQYVSRRATRSRAAASHRARVASRRIALRAFASLPRRHAAAQRASSRVALCIARARYVARRVTLRACARWRRACSRFVAFLHHAAFASRTSRFASSRTFRAHVVGRRRGRQGAGARTARARGRASMLRAYEMHDGARAGYETKEEIS